MADHIIVSSLINITTVKTQMRNTLYLRNNFISYFTLQPDLRYHHKIMFILIIKSIDTITQLYFIRSSNKLQFNILYIIVRVSETILHVIDKIQRNANSNQLSCRINHKQVIREIEFRQFSCKENLSFTGFLFQLRI